MELEVCKNCEHAIFMKFEDRKYLAGCAIHKKILDQINCMNNKEKELTTRRTTY